MYIPNVCTNIVMGRTKVLLLVLSSARNLLTNSYLPGENAQVNINDIRYLIASYLIARKRVNCLNLNTGKSKQCVCERRLKRIDIFFIFRIVKYYVNINCILIYCLKTATSRACHNETKYNLCVDFECHLHLHCSRCGRQFKARITYVCLISRCDRNY